MRTYHVVYNNVDDCREVFSTCNLKEAKKIALDTVQGRRFFQDDHTNEYHSKGSVQIHDENDNEYYFRSCTKKKH
jgi:hypothetical protein